MTPSPQYFATLQQYKSVFLTGASGYLGGYILRELMESSSAIVHCLVRGRGEHVSRIRLETALKKLGIWKPEYSSRIRVWSGDLESPLFGLNPDQVAELQGSLDLIIHCGAKVSWTSSLESLEAANVQSCVEVLRLSQGQHRIPISYVSTIAVLSYLDATLSDAYDEQDPPAPSAKPLGGYIESKWKGEILMRNAREQGAPVRIFRPGLICGPEKQGFIHHDYFFSAVLKAMLESGKAFRFYNYWEITPVDYAAKALLYLSMAKNLPMDTFHIMNSSGRTNIEVVDILRRYGYPLEMLEVEDWQRQMREECERSPTHAFANMKSLLEDKGQGSFFSTYIRLPIWLAFKTRKLLKPVGITVSLFDDDYFRPYFQSLIQSGFIKVSAGTTVNHSHPELPPLPLDRLGRFTGKLVEKTLRSANNTTHCTPLVYCNFGDKSGPATEPIQDLRQLGDAKHVRLLYDFSNIPGNTKNYADLESQIRQLAKSTFELCKSIDEIPMQSLAIHLAHSLTDGKRTHPLAALLIGFFRSLARELPRIRTTIVASDTNYANMKTTIEDEICGQADRLPIMYVNGKRLIAEPVETTEFAVQSRPHLSDGDTILVTGGGRGIGAFLCRNLAQIFPKCKLAIIGRAAPGKYTQVINDLIKKYGALTQENYIRFKMEESGKQINVKSVVDTYKSIVAEKEMQDNLDALTRMGVEFKYFPCDVTHADQMRTTVQEIYRLYSKIDTVIHGAGVENSKSLKLKPWSEFETTTSIKIMGLLNLLKCIDPGRVKQWLNFGSVTTWRELAGQTDYNSANHFLNAMSEQMNSLYPNCRMATINWHGWAETGIVARDRNIQATLDSQEIVLVDSKSGMDFFLSDVLFGRTDELRVFYFARENKSFVYEDPALRSK